jgi:triphosphoribosyl-dephospho-CoA synthase
MKDPAIAASPLVVSNTAPRPPQRPEGPISCGGASYTMARMAVKEGRRSGSDPAAGSRPSTEAVAGAAQLACVLEASAEKPGNITPSHDFDDTSYEDMLRSAVALGPEIARAGERGVGDTVLAAVRATRRVAGANTNLGIALLLAPLARAALLGGDRRERVADVLGALTLDDARVAYEAIRLAGAGGLDEPVEHDVRDAPTVTLREAMAAAAGRDTVAAEYATGFAVTFDIGHPALRRALDDGLGPRPATVEAFLALLAAVPDTLVARKRGRPAAERVSAEAASVLAAGGVRSAGGREALAAFDASLRRDGNALNPGTTADLVTAALFVALLEGAL